MEEYDKDLYFVAVKLFIRNGDYKYRFAQILRQPPRVKIIETR